MVVYRPPSYTVHENSQLIDYLTQVTNFNELIILGDFNLPSIDWINGNTDLYMLPTDRRFMEFFNDTGLLQMIHEPTNFPSCTTIDLCLVTDPERICTAEILPPLPNCSHGVIKVLYTFQSNMDSQETGCPSNRIWSRANFRAMRSYLEQIDWRQEFADLSVNEMYQVFFRMFKLLENRYVPKRQPSNKLGVPWSINPPRGMVRSKRLAWSNYIAAKSSYGRPHALTAEA